MLVVPATGAVQMPHLSDARVGYLDDLACLVIGLGEQESMLTRPITYGDADVGAGPAVFYRFDNCIHEQALTPGRSLQTGSVMSATVASKDAMRSAASTVSATPWAPPPMETTPSSERSAITGHGCVAP